MNERQFVQMFVTREAALPRRAELHAFALIRNPRLSRAPGVIPDPVSYPLILIGDPQDRSEMVSMQVPRLLVQGLTDRTGSFLGFVLVKYRVCVPRVGLDYREHAVAVGYVV